MLTKKDVHKLRNIFSRYPEIKAVYLFGSRATGKARADSDLDLGCYTNVIPVPPIKLEVLKDLAAGGFDHVDLVMLAKADLVTQYEVVRLNKLVYATDAFNRGEIYSNVVRKYLDLLPYLDVQREAYKQRMLHAET